MKIKHHNPKKKRISIQHRKHSKKKYGELVMNKKYLINVVKSF